MQEGEMLALPTEMRRRPDTEFGTLVVCRLGGVGTNCERIDIEPLMSATPSFAVKPPPVGAILYFVKQRAPNRVARFAVINGVKRRLTG